jgi:hypothetical protein
MRRVPCGAEGLSQRFGMPNDGENVTLTSKFSGRLATNHDNYGLDCDDYSSPMVCETSSVSRSQGTASGGEMPAPKALSEDWPRGWVGNPFGGGGDCGLAITVADCKLTACIRSTCIL